MENSVITRLTVAVSMWEDGDFRVVRADRVSSCWQRMLSGCLQAPVMAVLRELIHCLSPCEQGKEALWDLQGAFEFFCLSLLSTSGALRRGAEDMAAVWKKMAPGGRPPNWDVFLSLCSVQTAVINVFKGGGLQSNELYALNENIRYLAGQNQCCVSIRRLRVLLTLRRDLLSPCCFSACC